MAWEKSMTNRFVVWKRAATVFAVAVLAHLTLPAISSAVINDAQQIVYDLLRLSIGKSQNVNVIKGTPEDRGDLNTVTVIAGPRKAPLLKALMRTTMRKCEVDEPCKAFPDIDTDTITIEVRDAAGNDPGDFEIKGTDRTSRMQFVRQEINYTFNKNAAFARAMVYTKEATAPSHTVGIYLLFNTRVTQITTNDPNEYALRSTFLAQENFRLFLLDEVADNDPLYDPYPIFLSTGRQ